MIENPSNSNNVSVDNTQNGKFYSNFANNNPSANPNGYPLNDTSTFTQQTQGRHQQNGAYKVQNKLNESFDCNAQAKYSQINNKILTNPNTQNNSPVNLKDKNYRRKLKMNELNAVKQPEQSFLNDSSVINSELPSRHSSIGTNSILNNIYGNKSRLA